MRAYNFLIEYNMTSLVNLFGDKLMAKWQAEGEPFKNDISDDEVTVEDLMKWMEQYDPTQNNKYITWIVNKYAGKKGGIARLEDIPTQLSAVLDTYEKLSRKNLLKPEHKNINQIKTLTDLHDITDEYKEEDTSSKQETSKAEEQEFYDDNKAELVFNDNEYKVVIPKTEKASCYFGKNTRWCTAGDNSNMFNEYDEDGPLYVILHKPTNEKWQWHFESGQYMDSRDERINIDEFLKKHKSAANVVIKHVGGLAKAAAVDPYGWFKYIKNPSAEMQLEAVEEDGRAIRWIKNPSEELQLVAVREYGTIIEWIKNPSEAVQLAAVVVEGQAIRYIENPSEAVQWAAVKQDGRVIEYIEKPTESVQLAAINQNGFAMQHIENPSEEMKLAAVKDTGYAIQYIKNPSEEMQLAAVTEYGPAIEYIKTPSEAVQLAAVEQDGWAIGYIINNGIIPSEAVQLAAINQDVRALKFIDNPSEEVQLWAVKQYGYAIRHIKNPSEAVKRAAQQNNESIDLTRLSVLSGIK